MTEFRVGDRVRYISKSTAGLTHGKIYDVVRINAQDGTPIVIDNDGDHRDRWHDDYEIVSRDDEELATLRAFKEMALERYPNLSEPESDDDAAYRLTKAYEAQERGTPYDLARNAIVWARANPRD